MGEAHGVPIRLSFAFRRRERAIVLYRGPIELRDDGRRVAEGHGEVHFSWLPRPGVTFVMPAQTMGGVVGETRIAIPPLGVDASVFLTSWNMSGGDVRGVVNRARFPPTDAIRELRFAVPNYLFMNRGDPLREKRRSGEHFWAGRNVLEAEGWELTLDGRSDARNVKERLRAKGGCEVTHSARLRRCDGAAFSDSEARDKLIALGCFFGLTCGHWAPPLVAYGHDERLSVVWRDWDPPTISPWRPAMSVIDVFHPESLDEVFAGFLRRWADPIWREPLLYATQMYVEANGPVYAETSLVLTQAALELIAWVRVVEDEQAYTGADFNKLKYGAADRIRKLFDWLELDPSIPATLASLGTEACRRNWVDGPHAIDALRNALIHPSKRERIEDTDLNARIDLHELGLWYAELALLRVVGFEGEYSSRLHSHSSGSVVPVPWGRTATPTAT